MIVLEMSRPPTSIPRAETRKFFPWMFQIKLGFVNRNFVNSVNPSTSATANSAFRSSWAPSSAANLISGIFSWPRTLPFHDTWRPSGNEIDASNGPEWVIEPFNDVTKDLGLGSRIVTLSMVKIAPSIIFCTIGLAKTGSNLCSVSSVWRGTFDWTNWSSVW